MKRKLRPSIEKALIVIEAAIVMIVVSIDQIEIKELPILLVIVLIAFANFAILKKWGKGLWKEQ